ncbi:carotenoid biosynthesis protein [Negadavirga shengliensis]|uniref:Carotenoid biosynthesis protein n=1 Tax=Negadavirga shengliensis TaxID=1389218 RepID=A0ABV9SVW9_9BACT
MRKYTAKFQATEQGSRILWGKLSLIILHVVGFVGMYLEFTRPLFQWLTPFHLLLCSAILLYFHRDWTIRFWLFMLLAFGGGMISEIIGVQTGLIFGSYSYGDLLGPKIFGVPWILGLNWFLLVYITGGIIHTVIWNDYLAAVAGALLMVLLDLNMEPVALELGFWQWEDQQIPLSNYLGWFAIAFLIHLFYRKLNFRKYNVLNPLMFLNLIFFFGLLSFIL